MSLSVKAGTIAAKTTTGNQAYTGIGFQPKAIIFFATLQTATGYTSHMQMCVGVATAAAERGVIGCASQDALSGSTDATKSQDDKAIQMMNVAGGTIALAAELVTFDADGFTLNFTTVTGTAILISYLALGGTDLTNAKVGRFTAGAGTGTQSVTGVGFQPDCVIALSVASATWPLTGNNHARISIGAFTATDQGASAFRDNGNATTNNDAVNWQRTDRCLLNVATTTAAAIEEYSFSSMDADGFTLNTPVTNSANMIYLALKGGSYKVFNETQRTSGGTKAKTGIGFLPKALFVFGANAASSTSINGNGRYSIGASDGSTHTGIWGAALNGSATREDDKANAAVLIRHSTPASATDAEATVQSFDSDGFVLNWSTADGTAREFIGVAFGDTPSGGIVKAGIGVIGRV